MKAVGGERWGDVEALPEAADNPEN